MNLSANNIQQHLQRGLKPIYVVAGDEPLQKMETLDAIRAQARKQGYNQREVFDVDRQFKWDELLASANSLSLFAELRILELRMPTGAPGKDGGAVLAEYAENLPDDAILIVQSGKIDKRSKNSKWYKALDAQGVMIDVWPVKATEIMGWIRNRLAQRGVQAEPEAVKMIAQRVEGNMLAAAQEIEKLLLLVGQNTQTLTAQQVVDAVANSARFTVFDLIDSALRGEVAVARCMRILSGLKAEGVLPVMLLSPIVTELRSLTDMAEQIANGAHPSQVVNRVWANRKSLIANALERLTVKDLHHLLAQAGELDQINKGAKRGDAWLALQQLILGLSGVYLMPDLDDLI